MLTSVCVTGRLGDLVEPNIRYVEVENPFGTYDGKNKVVMVPVHSSLGKSTTFFKAANGASVIVKGRLERYGSVGLCVHSEIEEILDFRKE